MLVHVGGTKQVVRALVWMLYQFQLARGEDGLETNIGEEQVFPRLITGG